MKFAPILALPFLLAACEGREAVAICASKGDVTGVIETAFHDADGLRIVERYDAESTQVTTLRDNLPEPALTVLWRIAETTMRALPEVEASACGLDRQAYVTVRFADGSEVSRQTSCEGNALDRVATEILSASALDRLDEATPVAASGRADIAAACGALP